jgi:sortase A
VSAAARAPGAAHRFGRAAAAALALAGAGLLADGLWIPAKAALAQQLLERAFAAGRAGGAPVRPWPWADFAPIARLRVPRLGVSVVALSGAAGATLAFGPGHLAGSAAPGEAGNTVLAGHRDTHFAFLQRLRGGDRLRLETPDGRARDYRVVAARVVHERETEWTAPTEDARLTLVTCWPFDALLPGGPWRFVVRADAESEPGAAAPATEPAAPR